MISSIAGEETRVVRRSVPCCQDCWHTGLIWFNARRLKGVRFLGTDLVVYTCYIVYICTIVQRINDDDDDDVTTLTTLVLPVHGHAVPWGSVCCSRFRGR